MRRIQALLLIFLLFLPGLYAQQITSEDDEEEIYTDWEDYSTSPYTRGDKTFTITAGILFPTVFGGIAGNNHGIRKVGGVGTLAFSFFINSNIFLGGEVSGMFIPTRGGSMFYMIPMGIRVGYQFVVRRFEFPLMLVIGGSPQLYLEENYFGLFIKGGASAFFRFSPDWSFGLNTFWWLVPQFPKDGPNVTGNFFELTLSARYHF